MSIIGVILKPGSSGPDVRELHEQLLAVGAVIAPAELTATNYGDSTGAAIRVFCQRYDIRACRLWTCRPVG
jgi:hypothetical protein